MTPAIITAKKANVTFQIHQYQHDASADSYGIEAAEKLSVDPNRVFKTLVVNLDNKQLAVAVLPVSSMLSMKLIAQAASAKKASMATKVDVQRSTGYVLGGVSPLGQKKRLKTIIDSSAQDFDSIYVSAGRRGLEIELNCADLATLTNAKFANISVQS